MNQTEWSVLWMVSQNVSRVEFSHQTRDLECFADKHSSPWNLPTTFHLDPIATIQQRCLPLLCALLFQQYHLFPICVVSTYNDSMKDLHKLCQILRNCQCKWPLGFLFGSKNFLQAPLGFLRSFCFGRRRLDPLGGQVLHHDCISMIFSRFTTFTENFVICCNQITRIFCTRYGSANASSARGPHDVGPLADLAISVFREVSINTVLPKSTLLVGVGSKDGSWEELACESQRSRTLSYTRFSLNSCSHSGMSEYNGSHRSISWSSFLYDFELLVRLVNGSPRSFLSTCSLDTDTGEESVPHRSSLVLVSLSLDTFLGVEVDELKEDVGWSISCLEGVMDVEEGKLEEVVDKPGTTIGTKFSVLHCMRIPFLMRCGFWPLIHS